MRILFVCGLVMAVLGIVSLAVPIPHNEREGVKFGGVSLGVETQHEERVPPIVSAVMILGGAGLMIAGKRRSA